MGQTEKSCSACKVVKPYGDFYRNDSGRKKGTLASRCKECTKASMRQYHRSKDRVKYAQEMREYRVANKEWLAPKMREWNAGFRKRRREKVLAAYGDMCACCYESEPSFLAVDHIFGGGRQHIRSLGSVHFYDWLIRNNFPPGFRLLCHNCNQAKGHYGTCPHERAAYDLPFAVRMEG